MKYIFTKLILTFVGIIFSTSLSYAAKSLDFSMHQDYISARAMSMGGAFSAVVDDHSALFYNPAALARRKDGRVRMFLGAGLDTGYQDLVSDIDTASKQANAEVAIGNVIQKNYGNQYYSRLPTLGGIWVRPNWGIAILPADLTLDLGLHQQVGPAISLNAYLDTTFAYGYARNVKWGQKGELSVGATAKMIHRVNASQTVSAGQLAGDSTIFDSSSADEGLFVDADLGLLYTPEIPQKGFLSFLKLAQPSFSLVIRNALDMGAVSNLHLMNEDSKTPDKLQRRIDVGSKFTLPKWWVFDTKFAFDIRDMTHTNWTLKKGMHAGFEMYWTVFRWWKGSWNLGYNQGYFTAGLGANLGIFQIDFATWGEEVGAADYPIESRRLMVELSLDF